MRPIIQLFSQKDSSTSWNSNWVDLGDNTACSIQVVFSSGHNLAGTLTLEGTNDTSYAGVTITGSSQNVTPSSASHLWNVTDAQYRYIRVVWTRTSGAGSMTGIVVQKDKVC